MIIRGDACHLPLADTSVDAVVTDPPYGLEFMGKGWDRLGDDTVSRSWDTRGRRENVPTVTPDDPGGRHGVSYKQQNPRCRSCGRAMQGRDTVKGFKVCSCAAPQPYMPNTYPLRMQSWHQLWAAECLRVLKPGGWLLAFGGTRTVHRLTCAIEDAGFEIRDGIDWIYGSGFAKSRAVYRLDVLPAVEERYGDARCDCLDTPNGRPDRDDKRRQGGPVPRVTGGPGSVSATEAAPADVSIRAGADTSGLRQLWTDDAPQAQRPETGSAAVLLADVRGCGAEETRLGDAAVRAGLEGPANRDSGAGQDVSVLRQDPGGERGRATRAPLGAVPVRGDEPAGEPRGAVRPLSPRDRGGDRPRIGVDPGGREPRRTVVNGDGGRLAALVRVCSWCGLPDRDWLASLEPLGTALKPAREPIVVARKPLTGTVAANVLAYGTGALNIDGCRVPAEPGTNFARPATSTGKHDGWRRPWMATADGVAREQAAKDAAAEAAAQLGRWPSNVVLSHPGDEDVGDWCGSGCVPGCPVAELDAQSGITKSTGGSGPASRGALGKSVYGRFANDRDDIANHGGLGDVGGASRFFPVFRYQAKADAAQRPRVDGVAHETVKPLELMRWLVRLVTPPGGLVLDPFAGSGTTAEACIVEGFRWVTLDRDVRYLPLVAARLGKPIQPVLFG